MRDEPVSPRRRTAMKRRLDQRLVDDGLAHSRARAQALIRAGQVTVNGQIADKPGSQVADGIHVDVREQDPYVGRGAHKILGALEAFGLDPLGCICLDVGASTGGFTDALLQRGAKRVYAVDVGRGQLAWRLRTDVRVVAMERTDIRVVTQLPEPIDLACLDVSFISLRLVLPSVRRLVRDEAPLLCLVKPQFEAGRGQVDRGGIVRRPDVHRRVLEEMADWLASSPWSAVDAAPSPITGTSGNREFWLLLTARDAAARGLPTAELLRRALKPVGPGATEPPP